MEEGGGRWNVEGRVEEGVCDVWGGEVRVHV